MTKEQALEIVKQALKRAKFDGHTLADFEVITKAVFVLDESQKEEKKDNEKKD